MELLLAVLYPEALTDTIYDRLSNAFLIGMILSVSFFFFCYSSPIFVLCNVPECVTLGPRSR